MRASSSITVRQRGDNRLQVWHDDGTRLLPFVSGHLTASYFFDLQMASLRLAVLSTSRPASMIGKAWWATRALRELWAAAGVID